MKVAAFIPARSGSKRIPGKNWQEVGGLTLVRRAIIAAVSGGCDEVVLSTDDLVMAPSEPAVTIHDRPAPLASDHAQIEAAIAHWWVRLDEKPDVIVLLQPTSPFRTAEHVRQAITLLTETGADCVVGVTAGHEAHFAGRLKPREGECTAACRGHQCAAVTWFDWHPFRDPASPRPRTQDLQPRGHENGSLYAFTASHWERTGNRMGGRMVALPMTKREGTDIDDHEDLEDARAIAERHGI